MPYSPPVGTVDLNLVGSDTPPVGTVDLNLGGGSGDDRNVTIAGRTGGVRAALILGAPVTATITARTGGARAGASITYDPNLLSAFHAVTDDDWQAGGLQGRCVVEKTQPAALLMSEGLSHWQAAPGLQSGSVNGWQAAAFAAGSGRETWQAGALMESVTDSHWQAAGFVEGVGIDQWQAGTFADHAAPVGWPAGPFLPLAAATRWQEGDRREVSYREGFREGRALQAVEIEVWQTAGYPGNAVNPIKDTLPIIQTLWGASLRLGCALPGTALRIGRVPCVFIAEREIAVQRSYMSINTAELVRWPDLTPLPVTAMTMETDFDSWCWSFSATLTGPDAWALVQPNPLACEVLATINGQQWKFLLDVPSINRSFNHDQVSLKGRSRSAWLHDPYTPSSDFSEANAREMVQLGEAALDNTGWTLNWQGENWLVPAGRYVGWNTPIGALIRLANATDDGLYTDPVLQVITLHPRWPAASWLLDGEVVDVLVPESAILSLSQSPVYTLPINGVYVSGESHGVLALVKIAGTDGAIQPSDPIVHELLCDAAGAAARQRGLNALSDAGSGFEMDAETLFNPPTFPLIRPGMVVSIAGMKGMSRSCRISATWSNGLQVKQSIGLERREVES